MISYIGPKSFSGREELITYMKPLLEHNTFSLDVETVSLNDTTPVGLGVGISPTEAFYFTLEPLDAEFPWDMLANLTVKKIFHNCLFDLPALDGANIDPAVEDTMIMAMLDCQPSNRLMDIANQIGIESHSMGEYLGKGQTTRDLPIEIVARKCMQDCMATFGIYEYLLPRINQDYYKTEMALIPILMQMSSRGLKIDQQERQRLEDKFVEDAEYYKKLCQQAGITNPNSPPQVGFMMAKRGNLLPMRRRKNKSGKWEMKLQTGVEHLEKLCDPLANAVIAYRHATKMLSTYILPLAGQDRAYTHWHLEAATGRISSTKRNLQNVPTTNETTGQTSLRTMFIPDNQHFTDWDASQIELRVLMYLSQDEEMLRIYKEDGDIHQETADFLHIDRKIAKNVNFAMIYGGDDQTLSNTAHIQNLRRCRELRSGWMEKYYGAARWITKTQIQGRQDGYVNTLYGRRLCLPVELNDAGEIDRKACNYPIQGSAAEIIKRVMIKCKDLPLLLQVHDELIANGDIQQQVMDMKLDEQAPFPQPYKIQLLDRWS